MMKIVHKNLRNNEKHDHKCSVCGRLGKWSETWSYVNLMRSKGRYTHEEEFVMCSDACRKKAVQMGRLEGRDLETRLD